MNKSLIIFGIVNITSDSFSDGGRYLAPNAAVRRRVSDGRGGRCDRPRSGIQQSRHRACFVRHRNRAYRAGAGRAQGRWHSVSLDLGYQPATQAYALSRVNIDYLNDIRGFPDAAFIRNWRNHLPNSSLCIRCRRRQIGASTRWRHHGSHCGVL